MPRSVRIAFVLTAFLLGSGLAIWLTAEWAGEVRPVGAVLARDAPDVPRSRPMLRGCQPRMQPPTDVAREDAPSEDLEDPIPRESSSGPAGYKSADVYDWLLARVEADPENTAGRPLASDVDISATFRAILAAGYSWRGSHKYKSWMRAACRHLRGRMREYSYAWQREHASEVAWRDDLLLAAAWLESYGMTESPIVASLAGDAAFSLLNAQSSSGGFGPGEGTFTCTVLASWVIKDAERLCGTRRKRKMSAYPLQWKQLAAMDLNASGEVLRAALRRASRFVQRYVDREGIVDLPPAEELWFESAQVRAGEAELDRRVGPTAAALLLRAFAGEAIHETTAGKRLSQWLVDRLPSAWPIARRQDPLGMTHVMFVLSLARGGALRKSLGAGDGYLYPGTKPFRAYEPDATRDPLPLRGVALGLLGRGAPHSYAAPHHLVTVPWK